MVGFNNALNTSITKVHGKKHIPCVTQGTLENLTE